MPSSSAVPRLPTSAFCCHDSGATVLAMAPRHQLLITGGKKGWISILDVPHKHQRQSFQAHESPVKALAVDPTEDCFISGSSEGNIRVFPTHSRKTRKSGSTGRNGGRGRERHCDPDSLQHGGADYSWLGSKDENATSHRCRRKAAVHSCLKFK